MKTRILYLIMLGIFISSVARAQWDVLSGQSKNLWVNLTNGVSLGATPYTWKSSGLGIASLTTNDSTAVAVFGASGTIGRIDVYATSNSGCDGDTSSIFFNVVAVLPYGASFLATSQTVCPANNHGGTGYAAVVRIDFTGGNVSTFTYTLDGVSHTQPVTPANTFYNLDVTTAYTIAQSGTAHPIKITSVESSIMPTGLEPTHTINVGTAPDISNIQF